MEAITKGIATQSLSAMKSCKNCVGHPVRNKWFVYLETREKLWS